MEILAYSHLTLNQDAFDPHHNTLERGRLRTATAIAGAFVLGSAAFQANPVTAQEAILSRNDSGTAVTRLQDRLAALGYFSVDSTGFYGSLTEEAVLRFQQDRGLEMDGIAGPQTFSALYGETSVAEVPAEVPTYQGSTNSSSSSSPVTTAEALPATAQLQRDLSAIGYDPGTVDGIFGEQTSRAIQSFQADYGLPANGVPTISTLQALDEALASGNYSPSAQSTGSNIASGGGAIALDVNRSITSPVADASVSSSATQVRVRPQQDELVVERGNQTGRIVVQNEPSTRPLATAAVIASGEREVEDLGAYPRLNQNAQQIALAPYSGSLGLGNDNTAVAQTATTPTAYTQTATTNTTPAVEVVDDYSLPYVVAIPERKYTTISDVQSIVPGAYQTESPKGNYVYAGSFAEREQAEALSRKLQNEGLDARVTYLP